VNAIPGTGAALANMLRGSVSLGADRYSAQLMAAGITAVSTTAYNLGTKAIEGVADAAKNPVVVLVVVDSALAWGVGNEAVAAYRGKCH